MRIHPIRLALCVAAVILMPSLALATPDPDAEVVLLRQDCTGLGNNCFTSMAALTGPGTGWVWTVRDPSASSPLLIDVGPGTFGKFDCPDGGASPNGWVTVRGAGRDQTLISGHYGVWGAGCEQLEFLSVGIEGETLGVVWLGGGSAVWTNSNIRVAANPVSSAPRAWAAVCSGGGTSRHDFFGTRLIAEGLGAGVNTGRVFWGACVDARFYGGDILLDFAGTGTGTQNGSAVVLREGGSLEVIGASLRARLRETGPVAELVGVHVDPQGAVPSGTGSFAMHGGIVSIVTTAGDVDVVGVRAGPGSEVSTTGTAFALKPSGTGGAERIAVVPGTPPAQVASPFLWEFGPSEPVAGLASVDGADLFVETDCGATGACSGGDEPHLMVYSTACEAAPHGDPWFDAATGQCRGDANP